MAIKQNIWMKLPRKFLTKNIALWNTLTRINGNIKNCFVPIFQPSSDIFWLWIQNCFLIAISDLFRFAFGSPSTTTFTSHTNYVTSWTQTTCQNQGFRENICKISNCHKYFFPHLPSKTISLEEIWMQLFAWLGAELFFICHPFILEIRKQTDDNTRPQESYAVYCGKTKPLWDFSERQDLNWIFGNLCWHLVLFVKKERWVLEQLSELCFKNSGIISPSAIIATL